MEAEESKISVWVCREEKLVSGLSKRTTCADVIRVLLEEQNLETRVSLSGSPQSYCVVEKWRGVERILPNKTKILRLWSAWGEEQENVRFVLVKNEASLPSNGPRSAEARVVLSKESPCVYKGTARVTMALSQEKQRRIVRKAFRKLDKINKKRAQAASKDESCMEKMETLVHLVISQDHTIRQQIQRIKELDREIDRYEAKVHFDRMKTHGINYVQDTYLVDANPDKVGEGGKTSPEEALAQFEEYARRCEEVIKLQEELAEHEALMESITTEIQEELNQRWMKRRHEELANKDAESTSGEASLRVTTQEHDEGSSALDVSSDNDLLLEEERIRTQLDTSLYIGLRLNTDLEAIRNDLDLTKEIWGAKEKELTDLLEKVNSLDFEEDSADNAELREESTIETDRLMALEGDSVWVEQARGLSKTCDGNDDDSDTGLSSMHSQDSDITPVCESLV
ncbi:ras association domain-containing protein 10 [Pimephales promelas]|uniref:ras association domain-containing protein 10 n=1 Tax=Pimephales promelas TaxID=90988 RepID=UPI001955D42A|nr:ras association domain-containing protein 10 [Pimephales promelas]KAG1941310.1 ras association domain-containing protein [Pimephales promelas]KAG1941311.1 ras association domain-containing protein [Pimephales promelas]KAG1941312.1 ras association domain-containing protein [Pimephales promelas]